MNTIMRTECSDGVMFTSMSACAMSSQVAIGQLCLMSVLEAHAVGGEGLRASGARDQEADKARWQRAPARPGPQAAETNTRTARVHTERRDMPAAQSRGREDRGPSAHAWPGALCPLLCPLRACTGPRAAPPPCLAYAPLGVDCALLLPAASNNNRRVGDRD